MMVEPCRFTTVAEAHTALLRRYAVEPWGREVAKLWVKVWGQGWI